MDGGQAENNSWDNYYSGLKSASDQGHMDYLMGVAQRSQNPPPEYWKPLPQETWSRRPGLTPQERLELPLADMYGRLAITDNPQSPPMRALKMVANNTPSLKNGILAVGQPQDLGLSRDWSGGHTFDKSGKSTIMLVPQVGYRTDPGMTMGHEIGHGLGGKLPLPSNPDPTSEGFAVGFQHGLYGDLAPPKHGYDKIFGDNQAYKAAKDLGANMAKQVLSGSMPDQAALNRQLLAISGQEPQETLDMGQGGGK